MIQIEFNKLSLKEKGHVVFQKGKYIASRQYYAQRLVLYDMKSFFAEVWYAPNKNKIHRIESLSQDDKRIDLYINSELDLD